MPKVKIEGLKELQEALKEKKTLDDVRRVVRFNGSELQKKIEENADFKMGYQTGRTKGSVGLEITDEGLTAESGPTTEYSPYLEYGTRFMEAQPFIKPAFDEQKKKFDKDMKKLVR